jgi:hypothetical protein
LVGEGLDFGEGEGGHEAGEVGFEAGLGGDARVGEEEALVEVVRDEDLDLLVDDAVGEEFAGVVGDEDAVDRGAWRVVSWYYSLGGLEKDIGRYRKPKMQTGQRQQGRH